MQTFDMVFLGENEESEAGENGSSGKSACERILTEQADTVKTWAENNWPWLVAGGAAFLLLTRKREK